MNSILRSSVQHFLVGLFMDYALKMLPYSLGERFFLDFMGRGTDILMTFVYFLLLLDMH